MLHYVENDDSALRAWIADIGHSAVRSDQARVGFEVVKGYKTLSEYDISFIRKYQPSLAIQDRRPLFGGGILHPSIRRGLDQNDIGLHGRDRQPDFYSLDGSLFGFPRTVNSVPFWPETRGWQRHILWPKSSDRAREDTDTNPWWSRWKLFRVPTLDLSTRPGRGLNRDGHWSTGRPPRHGTPDGRHERERKRCTSEPPPGSFASAEVPKVYDGSGIDLIFPRMTFSQLDRRSRSRSLSRTRIAEMFDWDVNVPDLRCEPLLAVGSRCANCSGAFHPTSRCTSPCGHCGAISPPFFDILKRSLIYPERIKTIPGISQNPHYAHHCPVAPKNRCKCAPFPTYHTAVMCDVACHRDCGNTAPPDSARHPNAMLCKSRCCMCGIRGHSGKDCTNKTCRCGGHHLGQDCCWNPTCRVPGCDRYLCGVHCCECGSTQRPFEDRRCWRCHGAEQPFQFAREKRRNRKARPSELGKDEGRARESTGDRKDTVLPLDVPARGRSKILVVQESIFGGPRINSLG